MVHLGDPYLVRVACVCNAPDNEYGKFGLCKNPVVPKASNTTKCKLMQHVNCLFCNVYIDPCNVYPAA